MVALSEPEVRTSIVRDDDVPWATLSPGIEVKMFRVGHHDNTWESMFRFAPGTVLPTHHHFGQVHAYTISGRWGYREYDWEATPGTYIYEEPRSVHTLEVPADADEPAIVFFVIHGGMLILLDTIEDTLGVDLPEDMDPGVAVQDGETLYDLYKAVIEADGGNVDAVICD